MSTVIYYHIGSTFGNNCCLFQCFPYCLKLSCVHSLCTVLLVLVLFVVLYVFIACSLHVLDVCTRGNEDFLFRISVFSQHHVMSHPVHPINIQIKICAEYRDMIPRPRLVCQEPGLRPIGRSPGVPDKSSRGLGSMSRYSAQILICFIAYIFSIFYFSVGLVGNLAELPPCTVPPATVHCYQNEAAQCSSDNQISQHALLRGSRKKHSLAFMPQNWWN